MNTVRRSRKEKTKGNIQEIDEEDVIKPKCVYEYDTGMGGMDMHEQIHACFPILGKSVKGCKKIFFSVMNIAFFNMFIILRIRWAGHVARMEEGRCVHKVLVGKPEGKRPLGRSRRRWEDNIKIDLQEVGRSCGDWMELARDRNRWRVLVSTVMTFRVP